MIVVKHHSLCVRDVFGAVYYDLDIINEIVIGDTS